MFVKYFLWMVLLCFFISCSNSGGGSSNQEKSKEEFSFLFQYGNSSSIGKSDKQDFCQAVAVDTSNNIFCAGSTKGSLDGLNSGGFDWFVIKLNAQGEKQWLKQFGTASDDFLEGIVIDNDGKIILTGCTKGSFTTETNGGDCDILVLKLEDSGEIVWSLQVGAEQADNYDFITDTSGFDTCLKVASDANGNIYCGGFTQGSLADTIEVNEGNQDLFVMKINSSGTIQWITQLGSTVKAFEDADTVNEESCSDIAVSSDGSSIYCAGSTYSSLGEEHSEILGAADKDSFLLKLNSSGEISWLKQLGKISQESSENSADDYFYSIALNSNGDPICAGSTNGSMGEDNSANNNYDILLMKFDQDNGNILWKKQLGATTKDLGFSSADNTQDDECYALYIDKNDYIYCGGSTIGNLGDFAADENFGEYDAFIMKFDNDGELIWTTQFGNTIEATNSTYDFSKSEIISDITVDSDGSIIAVGSTYGDFVEDNLGKDIQDENLDLLILKLKSSGEL